MPILPPFHAAPNPIVPSIIAVSAATSPTTLPGSSVTLLPASSHTSSYLPSIMPLLAILTSASSRYERLSTGSSSPVASDLPAVYMSVVYPLTVPYPPTPMLRTNRPTRSNGPSFLCAACCSLFCVGLLAV